MADSDIITTLPFVRWRRRDGFDVAFAGVTVAAEAGEPFKAGAEDPATVLARVWRDAHKSTLALCRLQQRLETRLRKTVIDPTCLSSHLASGNASYLQAKDAEGRAAEAEELLLEELARTPAQTIEGIVAKLEVVLLEGQISGAPSGFPWPHIRSVLDDLRRVAAAPMRPAPSERRE